MTHKKVDDPFRRKALRVFDAQKPLCSRKRLGRDLVHHALDSLEHRQIRLRFGDHPHASAVCGKKPIVGFRLRKHVTDAIAVLAEPKKLGGTVLSTVSGDASPQFYDRIIFCNQPNLFAPFVSVMRQHRSTSTRGTGRARDS